MLVLSRKKNESIVIDLGGGQTATVTVLGIEHGKVRLGIRAPKEFPVHRDEVHERIYGKPADTEGNDIVAKPAE